MIRLDNGNRAMILSLAARRKGIARCTALHLDCARVGVMKFQVRAVPRTRRTRSATPTDQTWKLPDIEKVK